MTKRTQDGRFATTHGMSKSSIYKTWISMIRRCKHPGDVNYPYYGARGIAVCDRWRKFENFVMDMGPKPSPTHSIHRINNNGDYEPMNCKWATASEQANGRRSTIMVGQHSISEHAALLGMNRNTVYDRKARGHPWFSPVKKKLTPSQVEYIRARYIRGKRGRRGSGNARELMAEFRISKSCFEKVASGKTFAHI